MLRVTTTRTGFIGGPAIRKTSITDCVHCIASGSNCRECNELYIVKDEKGNDIFSSYREEEINDFIKQHENNKISLKYYEDPTNKNDHITKICDDGQMGLHHCLLDIFTHEQLAEFRSKIVEMSNHVDNLTNEKRVCRSEVSTYMLQSTYGGCGLSYAVSTIDGMIRNEEFEVIIGFFDGEEDTSVCFSLKTKPTMKSPLTERLQVLVRFLNALYNMTEIRSPEETKVEFISASSALQRYWYLEVPDITCPSYSSIKNYPEKIITAGKEITT